MKKNYLIPEMCVIKVDSTNMIAESITGTSDNLGTSGFHYGGASTNNTSGIVRVKDQGAYDVWEDDWSAE